MILRRFKILIAFILLIFSIILVLPSNISYGITLSNNELRYKIIESQKDYLNLNKTDVTVDTMERTVTLGKDTFIPPDVIKFINSEEQPDDFVILTNEGLSYYASTGNDFEVVDSLGVHIQNPYGVAVSSANGMPSYFISQMDSNGTGDIKHFLYGGDTMVENPGFEIAGVEFITSLSTFTESNSLGFSTQDAFKFNVNADGQSYTEVDSMSMQSPLSISAGSQGYNFSVLKEDKVERYMFDGSSFSRVPLLEIALDQSMGKPKAIVLDDINNNTYVLTDTQMRAYSYVANEGMVYNAALSIKSGLNKPHAITFNQSNNSVIILDSDANGKHKGRYFMVDETGGYSEVSQLSKIFNDIVSSAKSTYNRRGVLHLGSFNTTSDYINLMRVRAYTETPKGTKITFQVSNTVDGNGDPLWVDSWVVENNNVLASNKGSITKYLNASGNVLSIPFGYNANGYPTYQSMNEDYGGTDGYDVESPDNPNVVPPITYKNSLWTKMPGNGSVVNVRAILETIDSSVSPKIFSPIGTNNEHNISDSDLTAIYIEVNAQPLKPEIGEIESPWVDPPQTPTGDELDYDPKDGWIYTTTPTLKWSFEDGDVEGEEVEQESFQVLVMARKSSGWEVVYNSNKISSSDYSYQVPLDDRLFYDADAYEFGLAVRVWDSMGGISEFSNTRTFKVLAYEMPRIVNIVNPNADGEIESPPKITDPTTHRPILPDYRKEDLLSAKAGSQITLAIDSVGPIISDPSLNAKFIVDIGGREVPLTMIDNYTMNPLGILSNRNTWLYNFYTEAPITEIPTGTVVKMRLAGACDPIEDGGTTIFYIPDYAEGVIKTGDTIYSDWQVVIQGRDAE